MSGGSSVPYRVRPNKAVDRELFLSLLVRLEPILDLRSYEYVGLGGPFLEDFRLVHARVGITRMASIEVEKAVHLRQAFNKPVGCITCIHSSLEDYLAETEFVKPVVLWLDYTDPRSLQTQIATFAAQVLTLPINSVVRVTLNANPASLGKPPVLEAGNAGTGAVPFKRTEMAWRLDKFRERLADYAPADLVEADMTQKRYGRVLLRTLSLAVQKSLLDDETRKVEWALATNYADGQAMATCTLVILPTGQSKDQEVTRLIRAWEWYSQPDAPLILDMPALSTLERLKLEASSDIEKEFDFDLPKSDMGENPFESFKKFYKVFPHFSRVEI